MTVSVVLILAFVCITSVVYGVASGKHPRWPTDRPSRAILHSSMAHRAKLFVARERLRLERQGCWQACPKTKENPTPIHLPVP